MHEDEDELTINEEEEEVQTFLYLGATTDKNLGTERKYKEKTRSAFSSISFQSMGIDHYSAYVNHSHINYN